MHTLALAAVAALALVTSAAAVFASDFQAQTVLPPFENVAHIVCVDQTIAVELLAVFEESVDRGETLLARLATRDACDRKPFSGKPVADVYTSKTRHTGQLREGHRPPRPHPESICCCTSCMITKLKQRQPT
jgi:hypothetical protein